MDGNRLVAVGEFDEWQPTTVDAGLNSFAVAAYGYSSHAYEMGEALFMSFCRHESKDGVSPHDFGSIVLFDRVRIQTASVQQSRDAWMLINEIVRRFTKNAGGRNPVAGIIMKAFPLDDEGMNTLLPKEEESREAFNHRQRAMMRL